MEATTTKNTTLKNSRLCGTPSITGKVAKTTGTAQFAHDVRLPGMLTAVVARAPLFGATVKSFDAAVAAHQSHDHGHALSVLVLIDPNLLPDEKKAKRDELIASWLPQVTELCRALGIPESQAETHARLALGAARGLLLDLLVSGDRAEVARAADLLNRLLLMSAQAGGAG